MKTAHTSTTYHLDTGSDGRDESDLEGTLEEVRADVMHHHDLTEWPQHWTLRPMAEHQLWIWVRKVW